MSDKTERHDPRSPLPCWKKLEEDHKKGISPGSQIPPDTIVLKTFDSYALYYSKNDNALYIKTLDYHPSPLKLPMEELFRMLADVQRIMKHEDDNA